MLAGYDWGGRAACIVAALWPERAAGLVSGGTGYNIQDIARAGDPVEPEQEHRFWYQYYFHTERGRAGLTKNRRDVCRLLWQLWSPQWRFDEATFEKTAVSFDNPDFVDVVIQSYRHRYGYAPGDPALLGIEAQLARQPKIGVPTINLAPPDPRKLLPPDGVYAVWVTIGGRGTGDGGRVGGMMNQGPRPTFGDETRTLEVHLFDFAGELTGASVTVAWVERLRDVRSFPSREALVAQLARDRDAARAQLNL